MDNSIYPSLIYELIPHSRWISSQISHRPYGLIGNPGLILNQNPHQDGKNIKLQQRRHILGPASRHIGHDPRGLEFQVRI